jgi:protein-S-isoprenylcysteine O-methyltransferase Ste14
VPLGIAILIVSGYLAAAGLYIVFVQKREQAEVIRKNVFSIVRHPIYLSEILLYFGLLMFKVTLTAVLVWGIAILFLHRISRYEEKLLLRRFGKEYAEYMQRVPMWLPKFWTK